MHTPFKKAVSLVLAAAMSLTMAIPTFAASERATDSGKLVIASISDVTLDSGTKTVDVKVTLDSGNVTISDAQITATVEPSNSNVVTAAVNGQVITLTKGSATGTATVKVNAGKTGYIGADEASFTVTVTGSTEPTITDITGVQAIAVTAPVTGVAPQTTIVAGTGYTGAITWNPAVASDGKFAANTEYTANITLTAANTHKFATGSTITVAGSTGVTGNTISGDVAGNTLKSAAKFPKTAAATVTKAIQSIAAKNPTLTVPYGTTLDAVKTQLGKATITYKASNAETNATEEVDAAWACTTYNASKAGEYTFTGTIADSVFANYATYNGNETVTAKVTVSADAKSDAKQITSFVIDKQTKASIDEPSGKITVNMPANTTVAALAPTIKVSDKATVTPASGAAQNFTNPVKYTVKAENGTTKEYTVTVVVAGITVKFDTVGGKPSVPEQTIASGKLATEPTNPTNPLTREGYTFAGWFTTSNYTGTAFDFSKPLATDTTLYAKWTVEKPKEYTVTFDTDGGSAVASQTIRKGNTASRPTATPTRTGYDFVSWVTTKNGSVPFNFTQIIKEDTTVYAKWISKEITRFEVKFNTDGGTVIDEQFVEKDTLALKPVDPQKPFYKFNDWYKDSAKKEKFDFAHERITKDITLYAKWDTAQFTVTFVNGGSVPSVTKDVNGKVALPRIEKTPESENGKDFVGWYETNAYGAFVGMNGDEYTVEKDITLCAVFSKKADDIKDSLDKVADLKSDSTPDTIIKAVEAVVEVANNVLTSVLEKDQLADLDKILQGALDGLVIKEKAVTTSSRPAVKSLATSMTFEGAALSLNLNNETDVANAKQATISLKINEDHRDEKDVKAAVLENFNAAAAAPDKVKVTKVVAIDIALDITGQGSNVNLKAPLKLKLPVPNGINKDKLQIIHFTGGSSEVVKHSFEGGEVVFYVTSLSPFAFAEVEKPEETVIPDKKPGGGGNPGGGGGGGTGGSSIVNKNIAANKKTVTTATTSYTTVNATAAANAATKAVSQSVGANAAVTFQNVKAIDPSIFKAINDAAVKAAKGAAKAVTVQMDTIVGGKVAARIYIDPVAAAKLTAPVGTVIETAANNAINAAVAKVFAKYFSNNVAVVTFSQKGAFGMPVSAAVKVDLSKLNASTLRFYSYDTATNNYTAIAQPAYFVDAAGYVHFNTTLGGSVVIADKPLTSK